MRIAETLTFVSFVLLWLGCRRLIRGQKVLICASSSMPCGCHVDAMWSVWMSPEGPLPRQEYADPRSFDLQEPHGATVPYCVLCPCQIVSKVGTPNSPAVLNIPCFIMVIYIYYMAYTTSSSFPSFAGYKLAQIIILWENPDLSHHFSFETIPIK